MYLINDLKSSQQYGQSFKMVIAMTAALIAGQNWDTG